MTLQTTMTSLTEVATLGSLGLAAYHHAGYPLVLKMFQKRAEPAPPVTAATPGVTIVMPAYNEARYIADKIRNIGALDYPAHRLRLIVICDGCTDETAALAREALTDPDIGHLDAMIVNRRENRGKVAVLNDTIPMADTEIVVLTDVSAMLPPDAIRRAVAHFVDPRLGAVGGTYKLREAGCGGEAAYWKMQRAVKRGEAALGAPLGLHGAFYAFRRIAWNPLPSDTINDDFVLPMKMFAQGWRVAYDEGIEAVEMERSDPAMERRRRRRIAAGNAQQLSRLLLILHPRHRGVAFAFASGKALRVVMPLLLTIGFVGGLTLARDSSLFAALAGLQIVGLLAAACGALLGAKAPRPLALARYLVAGHLASLEGVWRYATGEFSRPWRPASEVPEGPFLHLPRSVCLTKRVLDIVMATLALAVSAPLWPLIALAIRLDSPGPVLFRQLRVGQARTDRTDLFRMIKFRTMYIDAEARGAVWATVNDPRITRVGLFLRKTRLDEIPQLINVLRGDMALVGPRPERPGFYGKLETAIPFFADRTVGLRPGITGLAQVNQGYDTSIDDVRRKVTFDHAYAMRLVSAWSWLRSDFGIMAKTVTVMATGRGQ